MNGAVALFSDQTGELAAMLDFHLVTKWKTAGDSLLAASKLARPDSRKITLLGRRGRCAVTCTRPIRRCFPMPVSPSGTAARTPRGPWPAPCPAARQPTTCKRRSSQADIVCTATMSTQPILRGDWLRPGQHIDLIGAFRPDMREADDAVLRRAALFVDSFETTLDHIGELKIPLSAGVITAIGYSSPIFMDSRIGAFARHSADAITVCKNGGGAHLDLMTARLYRCKSCRQLDDSDFPCKPENFVAWHEKGKQPSDHDRP